MIYGIGTDIVKINRIAKLIDKYDDKFIKKILSQKEYNTLPSERRIEFISGRFAAKEALYKALGKTFELGFTEIEIMNDKNRKPYFSNLCIFIKKLNLEKKTSLNIHLSISHEMEYAIAFVVIETYHTNLWI